jgi:hypothetical protein
MYLKGIGYRGVGWVKLVQDSLVTGSCEHGNEPSGFIRGGKFSDKVGDC